MTQIKKDSFTIEHIVDGNYLSIRVFAVVTRALLRECAMEADALCRKVSCRGYLYDTRGAPNLSPDFDNYQFVYSDMDEMELQRSIRSAILINQGEKTHDFPEVLLHNAGYNVKLFTDEQEAIAWVTHLT